MVLMSDQNWYITVRNGIDRLFTILISAGHGVWCTVNLLVSKKKEIIL